MSRLTVHFGLITAVALAATLVGCRPSTSPTKVVREAPSAAPRKLEPEKPARMAKPEFVRGVYLTAWSAGSTRKMAKVNALIDGTEINSVVIDLRDAGIIYVKTPSALAKEVGATQRAIRDLPKLVAGLTEKGIYPIARIACFRDNFVPNKMPQRAVVEESGKVWKDRAGYAWLDPYNKKNWSYIEEIVEVALDAGFPEIQLDYVRFPSEGKKRTMRFPARTSYPDPKAEPTHVVRDFSAHIRDVVHAKGALLSADIFGIMSSSRDDQGIGQELNTVAEPYDIISPMVYPSHYAKGEYGISDPNQAPYAILKKSLKDFKTRLPDKEIRPWLQDFSLGGVTYGKNQVRAQIKACYELGYTSFLLWNPKNNYTESAVVSTKNLMPKPKPAEAEKPKQAEPVG